MILPHTILQRGKRGFAALLLVWAAGSAQSYVPGEHYFGRNNYVEFIAGNGPFIVSAPHGGSLEPAEIPDRSYGTLTKDANTEELVREIQSVYYAVTGTYPHVVICRLHRKKLDANREIVEGAQGNAFAVQAWNEFQAFIDSAKADVIRTHGKGFYIDIHGHGHSKQRLELGYLLSASHLNLSDNTLNASTGYRNISSIRTVAAEAGVPFAEILRGESSFGTFMEYRGYPSVPSLLQPTPASDPYFNGGYNTERHGSHDGGTISGLQIESNYTGVRDTDANRKAYAKAIVETVRDFMNLYLFKTTAMSKPELKLNEILFDVPADDPSTAELEGDANGDGVRSARGDEFVEIVNAGTTDADVGGYRIVLRDRNSVFTFPDNTILAPGEMAVVFGGVGPSGFGPGFPSSLQLFAAKPGQADSGFFTSSSKTNLLSAGDNVLLIDPAINYAADELCWGSSSPNTQYGKKLTAPNTLNGDSISGAIQQSVTRAVPGYGLWTQHEDLSSTPYSPGSSGVTAVETDRPAIPSDVMLYQNFPNPFNPATTIRFRLSAGGMVTVTVSTLLGGIVAQPVNGYREPGMHSVRFDASSLPTGLYFYTIRTGIHSATRSMLYIK